MPPVRIRHDGHPIGLIRRLGLGERTSDDRPHAERRKELGRDARDRFALGRSGFAHDRDRVAVDGDAREGSDAPAAFVIVRQRHAVVRDARFRVGVEHLDQPLAFRERQRTEQHRIHDSKDGQVRAQADRDRGKRGSRERRHLAHQAKRVPEVLPEHVEDAQPASVAAMARDGIHVPAPFVWQPDEACAGKTAGRWEGFPGGATLEP